MGGVSEDLLSSVLEDIEKTFATVCGATRNEYADDMGMVEHFTLYPEFIHSLYYTHNDCNTAIASDDDGVQEMPVLSDEKDFAYEKMHIDVRV